MGWYRQKAKIKESGKTQEEIQAICSTLKCAVGIVPTWEFDFSHAAAPSI
jgi:hypothetical protein